MDQSDSVSTSLRKLGAVDDESEATITGKEIRAAASMPASDFWVHDSIIPTQGKVGSISVSDKRAQVLLDEVMKRVQVLEEEEIRELLSDRFGFNCCWFNKNPSKWSIQKVEDCNSYIGTLETFIEERDVVDEIQPYVEGTFECKDKGRMPNAWDMDMKAEIPLLFISGKEASKKIPYSEVVRICDGCSGYGKLAYNGPQSRRKNQDISRNKRDSSQHWITCKLCCGHGALLHSKILVVRWKTVVLKRVCATKFAKSVPDEVFRRVKGVRLYQSQSYQCDPACFPDSSSLRKFSESIISERNPIPESARIICERHQISLMPVTRVDLANKNKSFKLYIMGLSKEIYAPARSFSFCGLCSIC